MKSSLKKFKELFLCHHFTENFSEFCFCWFWVLTLGPQLAKKHLVNEPRLLVETLILVIIV
jgi:hypothetical protein